MKHDIFEFNMKDMTRGQRLVRVVFLLTVLGVLAMDLMYWRAG